MALKLIFYISRKKERKKWNLKKEISEINRVINKDVKYLDGNSASAANRTNQVIYKYSTRKLTVSQAPVSQIKIAARNDIVNYTANAFNKHIIKHAASLSYRVITRPLCGQFVHVKLFNTGNKVALNLVEQSGVKTRWKIRAINIESKKKKKKYKFWQEIFSMDQKMWVLHKIIYSQSPLYPFFTYYFYFYTSNLFSLLFWFILKYSFQLFKQQNYFSITFPILLRA